MSEQKEKLTYLAGGPDGKVQVKTALRAMSGLEVLIKVTHSGVCGTDGHDRTAGCGLGHEGAGLVEKIGKEVTALKVGQRVGWGWMVSSCGHCGQCITGYRQYCASALGQKYGDVDQGAFGDYVIKHQDFAYPIPDEIESKYAGPLNCAGITVYEALHAAGTKSTDVVGVVGLGGLGHLAVMYARAMGCDVTVFSGSKSKKEDAMKLGATDFRLLPKKGDKADASQASINVMLLCGGGIPDFEIILPLLARQATIVPVVIQEKPLVIPYFEFLIPGHRIVASTDGTRENHIQALTFAARHNIRPWIKEYPMTVQGLTDAFTALDNGELRFRAVLSTELGEVQ